MTDGITIQRHIGSVPDEVLTAISELRVTVFRAWPYLYDGAAEYEASYLSEFAAAEDAVVISAMADGRTIGAATAAPLMSHTPEFAELFAAHGYDPDGVFYLGESVLLSEFRGRGIGHAFFDEREAAGREIGAKRGRPFNVFSFCGVVRQPDDPRRDADVRPLDPFWRRRGYQPVEGMLGNYDWAEDGSTVEVPHPMQFWVRPAGV
ncbi:MAG: GNAT family N-acetyltransferase [Pseudomonadota bacterium]